jgi:hypothetical protein
MDKIDKMVLPLPYAQLLKYFLCFFIFSLPFVIAPAVGPWTPPVSIFAALGYFGLDSIGSELEAPFGTDPNDFPLLKMGAALCNDLDSIVRTCSRQRLDARQRAVEGSRVVAAARAHLGWGGVAVGRESEDAGQHAHEVPLTPRVAANAAALPAVKNRNFDHYAT